jgi:hypothetical protein
MRNTHRLGNVLHSERAARRLDRAREVDQQAVADALDDPSLVQGDAGLDQLAQMRP